MHLHDHSLVPGGNCSTSNVDLAKLIRLLEYSIAKFEYSRGIMLPIGVGCSKAGYVRGRKHAPLNSKCKKKAAKDLESVGGYNSVLPQSRVPGLLCPFSSFALVCGWDFVPMLGMETRGSC